MIFFFSVVYRAASIPFEWTMTLMEECQEVGIDYFSPYDFSAIDFLDQYVPVYKAEFRRNRLDRSAGTHGSKGKPFFVATGASTIGEVQKAVHAILKINRQLVLMQCNTNYTASPNNYDHLHINVLKTYATLFPDVILGLSDHTHAVAPVLGAVTLGARHRASSSPTATTAKVLTTSSRWTRQMGRMVEETTSGAPWLYG